MLYAPVSRAIQPFSGLMSAIRATLVYIPPPAVYDVLNGVCVLCAPNCTKVLNRFCFLFHPEVLFSPLGGDDPIHHTSVCT